MSGREEPVICPFLKKINSETKAFTDPMPCFRSDIQSNPLNFQICVACAVFDLANRLAETFKGLGELGAKLLTPQNEENPYAV